MISLGSRKDLIESSHKIISIILLNLQGNFIILKYIHFKIFTFIYLSGIIIFQSNVTDF
jgi:hypothetical protein